MILRLDAILSRFSPCSRTEARLIARAGRVTVNGKALADPAAKVDTDSLILADGKVLDARPCRHYMMNKPSGLLTAAEDSRAETVMALLPPVCQSIGCMPVGRLDKDTEGLLLFTTDGDLAHRLISPKRHVWKEYEATVEGKLDEKDVAAFHEGVELKDFTALPAELIILNAESARSVARARVREGKYHQIKRMFGRLGHEVISLRRLRFGPLALDERLLPGEFRELTQDEIALLYEAAGDRTNE